MYNYPLSKLYKQCCTAKILNIESYFCTAAYNNNIKLICANNSSVFDK